MNLLEELTELRKAFIVMVIVYYAKQIQSEISKGRRHMGQNPAVPSWWSHVDVLTSPSGMCSKPHIWRTANQGSSPEPWYQSFFGAHHIGMTDCWGA